MNGLRIQISEFRPLRFRCRAGLLALSCIFGLIMVPATAADRWAQVASPIHGRAEVIGKDTAGCVSGAVRLPLDGKGYHVMRPSRYRFFGHPILVRFVRTLGQELADKHNAAMLVGDLAQPRGGPTPSLHRSHQTGLDVDIWWWLPAISNERAVTNTEREKWVSPSVVSAGGQSVDRTRWTSVQADMLRLAAQRSEVDRIFVHPAIKRELCATVRDRSWLRKVRPWWGHDEHFHVRLRCPAGDGRCIAQEPLPEGDGCDATLTWWFSHEARETELRPAKLTRPAPMLPQACMAVLHAPDGFDRHPERRAARQRGASSTDRS